MKLLSINHSNNIELREIIYGLGAGPPIITNLGGGDGGELPHPEEHFLGAPICFFMGNAAPQALLLFFKLPLPPKS